MSPFPTFTDAIIRTAGRQAAGPTAGQTAARFRRIPGGHDGLDVRRARPSDEALVLDLFDRISAESRYRRFHGMPGDKVIRLEAQRVARGAEGLWAWVATAPDGSVIGTLSIVEGHDGEFEVAVLIDDDWQGHGLAGRLARTSLAFAAEQGVGNVVAWVQGDNQRAVHVFRSLPDAKATFADGEIRVDVPTAPHRRSTASRAVIRQHPLRRAS